MPLTVSSLVDEARRLARAGDQAEVAFTDALDLLLRSCRGTAELSSLGWQVLAKAALRHLRNQLYLQRYLAARPEPGPPPAAECVVITGLPRTGTSLLHQLLALDPANRVLRVWEALHPIPPGAEAGISEEVLVDKAAVWLERLYAMAPELRAIHPLDAEAPEECDVLLQNTFASQHFDDMFDAREYSSWLNGADLSAHYAHYALQLRVLAGHGRDGRPWVLKSPGHLGHLPELVASLPGCKVVHCHRHPAEAVPSYASLVRAVRRPYSEVSPAVVGQQCLSRCGQAVERALAFRQWGEGAVIDVSYRDLVRDPVRVVGWVYEGVGRAVGPSFRARMVEWLHHNPQHKHGR
ncbi:MAG TPA: sulfotransferase, partial [bacterium]|nr:sulfotransferase [bacterium]